MFRFSVALAVSMLVAGCGGRSGNTSPADDAAAGDSDTGTDDGAPDGGNDSGIDPGCDGIFPYRCSGVCVRVPC